VASDGNDYGRYLAGADGPDPERKGAWLNFLRSEYERGLRRSRVHILRTPLADRYLAYEVEWGYLPNVEAGEDVRILDLSEVEVVAEERDLIGAAGDFWLLNSEQVVRMHYSETGQFEGAELVADPDPFLRVARMAWDRSERVTSWWARHPEEHRANRHAA
jgi:hypothetical protein